MLHLLLRNGDIDFNILLLQDRGDTLLHFVLCTPREQFHDNKEDVVKLLLRTGVSPLQRDRLGDTALHLLAGDNRPAESSIDGGRLLLFLLDGLPELLKPILASINSKNNYSDIALVVATLYNNIKYIRLLLRHGANPYEPGENAMTALDFTMQRGYGDITELLLNHIVEGKREQQEAIET